MKKNKLNILFAAVCVAAIGACFTGSTFAQFTDEDSKNNVFTIADITTEIEENFEKVTENQYVKTVKVANIGQTKCLVRVRVNITPDEQTSNIYVDGLNYYSWLQTFTDWNNESNWWYNQNDGFFYYKDILYINEETTNIMNRIDIIDTAKMNDFDIIIYEESVQTEVHGGNGSLIAYDGTGDSIVSIFNVYNGV